MNNRYFALTAGRKYSWGAFDALLTQSEILNTIEEQGNRYIAKLKDNQKKLKEKAIATIEVFNEPTDIVNDEDSYLTENNKRVSRKVEVFHNKSADLIMYHESFKNIQSLVKVTKTLTSPITGEVTTTTQYLMANFKTTAKEFHQKILQHWRVETYHYHCTKRVKKSGNFAL